MTLYGTRCYWKRPSAAGLANRESFRPTSSTKCCCLSFLVLQRTNIQRRAVFSTASNKFNITETDGDDAQAAV